jgi:ankyrin repeat protein
VGLGALGWVWGPWGWAGRMAAALNLRLSRRCLKGGRGEKPRPTRGSIPRPSPPQVLDQLLDAGANPNYRDNLGGCALQEAVKAGHADIAQVGTLEAGAAAAGRGQK